MTKISQVISFFIIISFLFFAAKYSFAQTFVSPLPNNSKTINTPRGWQAGALAQAMTPPMVEESEVSNSPSITFGDLLSNPQPTTHNPQPDLSTKSVAIKELLDRLEASSYESKKELVEFSQRLSTTNYPSPTPYIPVPTLIAGVSEIVNNSNVILSSDLIGTKNLSRMRESSETSSEILRLTPQDDKNLSNTGNLNQNPIKTTYTIAVLGDSMVDTLGRDLPNLRQLLSENFPNYTFALLNYGQGATDLESGLYRLTNTTTYLGETFAPLLSFKPDILVVESFAYNHWSAEKYDLDRQWLTIAKIIDTVKENSPDTKIVLAATIAPNSDIFGDGSLNWPTNLKWEGAQITRAYLQNMVNFATSEHYPVANAYHPSLGADGKGLTRYINGGDNLHPSGDGGLLFSQKIVEAIKEKKIIQ